jgi:phenylacetate-CoA ligase
MYRWIAWNLVFRLHERLKRHPTFEILREMEQADQLTAAEFEQLRNRKLQSFIEQCYRHVPYVRMRMQECGVEPRDIQQPADLQRLPLMTKADVRQNRQSLRSTKAGPLAPFTTGGSTGQTLIFDLSKRRVASRVALRQRASQWWGLSVGDSEVAVWGAPVELTRQDWMRGIRDRLLATQLLPAFEMNEQTMSRYLDIIERRRPRQIFGYPSSLYQLCLHARKERRNLRRLGIKVAFVTGEVLFPHQRSLIAETLNCPVGNQYGGRDAGFIAHECPQGGMHVMADAVIVEIVDSQGRPVPPGVSGEIVVTDLYSEDAPFLRYATGDIAAASPHRCPCGRNLPLLERIEGRSNDSILTPDGRQINSLALIYALREIEGIVQFRVVQQALTRFEVQIVRDERFRKENEARIRDQWTLLLRAPLEITFEYPEEIASERSGKFRHVVSHVSPSPYPAQPLVAPH